MKDIRTDGSVRDVVLMRDVVARNEQPSTTVVQVVGGTMGESAAREGVTEAARRLSHALAEIANVLETDLHSGRADCSGARVEVLRKTKDALKEWGVA